MEVQSDRTASTGHQVLSLLLESAWEHFFIYLSKMEIVKLDSALTDKSLRELYFNRISKFLSNRIIFSSAELAWILKRDVELTTCLLYFDFNGNTIEYKLYLCVP